MIPSIETIDASGIVSNIDDAKFIRTILEMATKYKNNRNKFLEWMHENRNDISESLGQVGWGPIPCTVLLALRCLDEFIDGYGVEAIFAENDEFWPIVDYVNKGDTYSATIVYRRDIDAFLVSDYGTQIEILERQGFTFC